MQQMRYSKHWIKKQIKGLMMGYCRTMSNATNEYMWTGMMSWINKIDSTNTIESSISVDKESFHISKQ